MLLLLLELMVGERTDTTQPSRKRVETFMSASRHASGGAGAKKEWGKMHRRTRKSSLHFLYFKNICIILRNTCNCIIKYTRFYTRKAINMHIISVNLFAIVGYNVSACTPLHIQMKRQEHPGNIFLEHFFLFVVSKFFKVENEGSFAK